MAFTEQQLRTGGFGCQILLWVFGLRLRHNLRFRPFLESRIIAQHLQGELEIIVLSEIDIAQIERLAAS